jgi:hypothetical protein
MYNVYITVSQISFKPLLLVEVTVNSHGRKTFVPITSKNSASGIDLGDNSFAPRRNFGEHSTIVAVILCICMVSIDILPRRFFSISICRRSVGKQI